MKTLQVLLLSVLLPIYGYGQQSKMTYGKAIYKYKYNFPTAAKDTSTAQLYFNSSGESYYVTPLIVSLGRTSNYSIDINKPSSTQTVDSSIVYRNLVKDEHIFNVHTQLKRFLVKDTIKAINWEYGKEERKIGSFMCQSATGVVSGRTYKVWYTTEIPVSTGPWKFYGLPGLVVEATDDMNLVVFLLDRVEISSKYQRDFEEDKLVQNSISREKLEETKRKDLEKMQAHAESMGVKLTYKVTNKGLELEY